jgi:hypothetical protein
LAATLQQLLDLVDERRFDVDALVKAADAFDALPDEETAGLIPGDEIGFSDAIHPLSREGIMAHEHPGVLVRDIEGDLHVLVRHDIAGWVAHLAGRSDFCSDEDLDYFFESGDGPEISTALIRAVIDGLADT